VPEHPLAAAAARAGVSDQRVLGAVASIPRADFIPPELATEAEVDKPIPIPHEQVTTQPSLVAAMVEALALTSSERVLEIGTGYGWQSALLARLAAQVWSIERWDDLAARARIHLGRSGATNVEVLVGDGSEGVPEHAPYDAILVSAAFPNVPPPLVAQLAEEGRLVQPLGRAGREQISTRGRAAHSGYHDCSGPGQRHVGNGPKGGRRSALRGEAEQGLAHTVGVDAGSGGRVVELQRAVTVSDVTSSHSGEDTAMSGQVTR